MPAAPIRVSAADWRTDQADIRAVRHAVFVVEQGIDASLEWDGQDAACRHVLARTAGGTAVATGRLTPEGRIGRMAVLVSWRGRGVGRAVLAELLRLAAARGHAGVFLLAQHDAAGFYRREGFQETGVPFEVAGILHVRMTRSVGS